MTDNEWDVHYGRCEIDIRATVSPRELCSLIMQAESQGFSKIAKWTREGRCETIVDLRLTTPSEPKQQPRQSGARNMFSDNVDAIIAELENNPRGLSISELTNSTGVSCSSTLVRSIIGGLLAQGIVQQAIRRKDDLHPKNARVYALARKPSN